jgi:adenine specific DNA methylase Mod
VEKNQLYYGDNLVVLREHIEDESVDLIYLDPPFNSRQDYNVLFAERDGTRSASQIMAFEDTWVQGAKKIDYPRFASDATFKKAPRARKAAEEQIPLGTGESEEPF